MSQARLDPVLDRALVAARAKRESRGPTGDGQVIVPDLGAEEALALDGLLEPRRPILAGATLRVGLSTFESVLRGLGIDPLAEYERVAGAPVRDLPAERAARVAERTSFADWLLGHPIASAHPQIGEWLAEAVRQGRVRPELRRLVERALTVVAALPVAGPPVQRTVLAARALGGDPHALDLGTPLHSLVIAMLSAGRGMAADAPPRAVWAAWGVLVDPISSNVAVLNLPLQGDSVVPRLCATARGSVLILTYAQLTIEPLVWPHGTPCFSCENPSVLIAAAGRLGPRCPPLVCTGGRPSDAVRIVFDAVAQAGGSLRHHGDSDLAGAQILDDLRRRHRAEAWEIDGDGAVEELVIGELLAALRTNR